MQDLWNALNRSGLVWAAFWGTVWVVAAIAFYALTGLIIKMDMQQVNAVLVPVRAGIESGLATVLQIVVDAFGFLFASYGNRSGAVNFIWASIATTARLCALLFGAVLLVFLGRHFYHGLTKAPTAVLNTTTTALEFLEEKTREKAREVKQEALAAVAQKLNALKAPDRMGALPAPPPANSTFMPSAPQPVTPVSVGSGRQTIDYQRPAGNRIPIHSQDHGDIMSLGLDERVSHAEPVVRNAYRAAHARATTDAEKVRAKEAWTRLCAYYGWSP